MCTDRPSKLPAGTSTPAGGPQSSRTIALPAEAQAPASTEDSQPTEPLLQDMQDPAAPKQHPSPASHRVSPALPFMVNSEHGDQASGQQARAAGTGNEAGTAVSRAATEQASLHKALYLSNLLSYCQELPQYIAGAGLRHKKIWQNNNNNNNNNNNKIIAAIVPS